MALPLGRGRLRFLWGRDLHERAQPASGPSTSVRPIATRPRHGRSRMKAAAAGLEVRRTAGALSAEIRDVDLSQPLSDQGVADIRRALLDPLAIFFLNQHLTP